MKAYYESRRGNVNAMINRKVMITNRNLLEDIYKNSRNITPYKDGDLRQLVTRRVENGNGVIVWTVPYAQYQERGKRWDGTHVVRHYTTPGTGKYFARTAVEQSMNSRNIAKFWKTA
ncbi:MAG: hypothetical protein HUJ63_10070 [Enterococcus sp.]|nr:hypothetical protein [Enterococcus sp.]